MMIEVYIDGKVFDCDLRHDDFGIYQIISKSDNVKDIRFDIVQNEQGFDEKIEMYL